MRNEIGQAKTNAGTFGSANSIFLRESISCGECTQYMTLRLFCNARTAISNT
jgi:hypothetical protein